MPTGGPRGYGEAPSGCPKLEGAGVCPCSQISLREGGGLLEFPLLFRSTLTCSAPTPTPSFQVTQSPGVGSPARVPAEGPPACPAHAPTSVIGQSRGCLPALVALQAVRLGGILLSYPHCRDGGLSVRKILGSLRVLSDTSAHSGGLVGD